MKYFNAWSHIAWTALIVVNIARASNNNPMEALFWILVLPVALIGAIRHTRNLLNP